MASLDSTNSITKTMKESLYGSEALPKQNIIIPGNDGVETTVTASGDTYTITVKNTNPKITMPGGAKDISVMPWAEYFGKDIKLSVNSDRNTEWRDIIRRLECRRNNYK